jgi:hypothetical protein
VASGPSTRQRRSRFSFSCTTVPARIREHREVRTRKRTPQRAIRHSRRIVAASTLRHVSDPHVTETLRSWMIASGRALEMTVAAEFMHRATSVEQSPYYEDPDTGTVREADVVAIFTSDLPQYVVSATVECKHTPPPFLVLLPPERQRVDMMRYRCLSRGALDKLPLPGDVAVVDLNGTAVFDPTKPVGYSVITMNRTKKSLTGDHAPDSPVGNPASNDRQQKDGIDKGYWAAVTAAKASSWYATAKDATDHPEAHVSFPIVVTDGVLATAQLGSDGEIHVHEAEHARVLLKRPVAGAPATVVDFVRASYLPSFAGEVASAAERLLRAIRPSGR